MTEKIRYTIAHVSQEIKALNKLGTMENISICIYRVSQLAIGIGDLMSETSSFKSNLGPVADRIKNSETRQRSQGSDTRTLKPFPIRLGLK